MDSSRQSARAAGTSSSHGMAQRQSLPQVVLMHLQAEQQTTFSLQPLWQQQLVLWQSKPMHSGHLQ